MYIVQCTVLLIILWTMKGSDMNKVTIQVHLCSGAYQWTSCESMYLVHFSWLWKMGRNGQKIPGQFYIVFCSTQCKYKCIMFFTCRFRKLIMMNLKPKTNPDSRLYDPRSRFVTYWAFMGRTRHRFNIPHDIAHLMHRPLFRRGVTSYNRAITNLMGSVVTRELG